MLTRDDVLWVLRNLLELRAGFWPERGWSDISGVKLQSFKTAFSRSCELAATIELRLKQCGLDGFLAKQIYAWNEDQDYLSLLCRGDIQRRADCAIEFVSNKWPKEFDYPVHKERHYEKMKKRRQRGTKI